MYNKLLFLRLLPKQPIILTFILLCGISIFSQTPKQITGKVTNEKNEPLTGVTVLLKGTTNGTATDAEGNYSLNISGNREVLVFSFVGFNSQEILVGNSSVVNVTLQANASSLKGVVVIGYGTQSRSQVTTSISKLDDKVLENIPYANVATALQGTLSGVRVKTTTGQPGAAPLVIVRGGTSINNPNGAAPLYIIDGVIRSNINDINAADIESIQVLKDAAATAIYGARGSNGVVLIETKSGKSGNIRITYNTNLTISNVNKKYDLVGGEDLIKFFRLGVVATARKIPARLTLLDAANPGGTGNDLTNRTPYTTQYLTPENEYKLSEGWSSMPDPIDPSKTIIFDQVDWQDILYRTGVSQNHYLSASGGTEKATFNMGAGYLTNNGIAIGTNYQRASLNLDGELKVKDNLKFIGRLMYSSSAHNGDNWPWDRSQAAPPTMKYKFEDGTIAPGDYFPSPPYRINSVVAKNSIDNLTMVIGAHWNILPGLSFDPQVSLYKITTDSRSFQKAYYSTVTQLISTRNASGSYSKYIQKQVDAVFSYKKSFKQTHNVEATAGFSYFGASNSTLSASGQGAATDLIPTLNASSQPVSVSGSESNKLILGYFSRINYNYQQRYLLSISGRYDGASNLGDANKWGFFPGVSLGWNVHKEKFWNIFPENLFQLKLRGSYGINGNLSGLGDYQAQGQYSVGDQYAGNAAIRNTIIANQNLQWERSKTLDGGLDLGLFNNRVSILFDYYRRVTDQLLTTLSLPQSTGFGSIFTNLGSLQNKGFEIELNIQILPTTSTSDFQWNVAFNAAKNKNKILKLPYNGTENNRIGGYYVWDSPKNSYAWMGGLQENGRIGDIYAFKQIGIYSTDEDAAKGPIDLLVAGNDKSKYGGDVNWQDADRNDTIDIRDRVYLGNIYPIWTGGFTNSISYKNLNLSVRLDFSTGNTIYNWSRALMLAQYGAYGGIVTDVLKSWQKQGDVTDIPKYYWADQQAQRNISRLSNTAIDGGNSQFYESGSYLALREVTLSYNLSEKLLQKIRINSLRIYLTGNNLFYFTHYKGLSPEVEGVDNGGYPIPRNIIIGANISL